MIPSPVSITGSHWKPWEAMLLTPLLPYIQEHFVSPLIHTLPNIRTIQMMGLR